MTNYLQQRKTNMEAQTLEIFREFPFEFYGRELTGLIFWHLTGNFILCALLDIKGIPMGGWIFAQFNFFWNPP